MCSTQTTAAERQLDALLAATRGLFARACMARGPCATEYLTAFVTPNAP
jgi:hypothetical protein